MMRTTSFGRRGSYAVEFALILPIFLLLIFGGIELLWYSVETGRVTSALTAGCRGGAATGINLFADPFARAADYISETVSRNSRFNCSAGDCFIVISESDLTTPDVIWMDCRVEVNYTSLTNFVPGLPTLITATSSQPITRPLEEEYE
jgi:Flp pilus assembly protein TadG